MFKDYTGLFGDLVGIILRTPPPNVRVGLDTAGNIKMSAGLYNTDM